MNGVYGTKKPANITSDDVDIFYFYRETRNTDTNNVWKRIESDNLVGVTCDGQSLPGMYNLKLPFDIFNSVGFYSVYIKPKEIKAEILDVSSLTAYPNIKGIVIDTSKLMGMKNVENNSLVGYRVEYFENDVRGDEFRIITSNNKCEPMAQNLNDGYSKGVTYRFNDTSTLTFCTLTPSTGMPFKSSDMPFIGRVGQEIVLINTKFNPVMIEVEITDTDLEGIATMLSGKQIRNLNKGIITTFDENGAIYHQAKYGTMAMSKKNINHDFKIPNTTNIDFDEEDILKEIEGKV